MNFYEIDSKFNDMTINFDKKSNMKALIVDDEFGAREVLRTLITDFFPSIEIVQICANLPECVKAIHAFKPDLIFLDIEMPGYSGLELYDFLNDEEFNFEVIFTTAYQEYAIDAFRLAAIDYLLKPIQFNQLKEAVDRFEAQHLNKTAMKQLKMIQNSLSSSLNQEICISTTEGKYYVSFNDLMYLEADGSYTNFYLTSGKRITASRRIKYFEESLSKDKRFLRVHRSYLLNKQHVERFKKGEDAHALLINNTKIPVSLDRLKELGV